MYEMALRGTGHARKDWKLAATVAVAAVMLLLLVLPLFFSGRHLYQFHRFTQDAAVSFVYGEQNGCLTASYDGEEWLVRDSGASQLYAVIVSKGAGRRKRQLPDGEGLTLDFGDVSSLRIYSVPFDGAARERDTGVLLRYERADRSVFAYDTDKLQFEEVLGYIR